MAGGRRGALVGGLCFVVPAVVSVLLLSVVLLGDDPPSWVLGAGLGAGAAVPAVALKAGSDLLLPVLRGTAARSVRLRWNAYALASGLAAALLGPLVVLALLACGLLELSARRRGLTPSSHRVVPNRSDERLAAGLAALMWTALKAGALSYGGGFVIIPLMQADATGQGWMTDPEFLNAVALGQITPGPVVATVVAVGYAAHGVLGGLLAGAIAFAPSFLVVVLGGGRFERLRGNPRARVFLDGAGPAAAGAILGAVVPLAGALSEPGQAAVLAGALLALLVARRGVVVTLLTAGVVGALVL